MATKTDVVDTGGYSSTARKVLILGKDGTTLATPTNPLPVDAVVTVDSMTINAEMNEATGHDYYTTTTNLGDDTDTIGFDIVAGLTLEKVITAENKTQGWVYNTKGAVVTTTSLQIIMANQEPGAPLPLSTDEFEIVYRDTSRFTDKTQMTNITDGTNELDVLVQDAAFGTTAKGLGVFGKYEVAPTTYTDGDAAPILLDANGRIVLSSDIQLGAVELKDADTENRANIKEADTARTTSTLVLATQAIDEAGAVLRTSSIETATEASAVDLAAIELLNTDIKTAVELIDDAVYSDGTGTPSKGILVMGSDGTNTQALSVNTDGELKVNLEAGDIEIGAVELKDATTDVRANIDAANTGRTTATNVLATQVIDEAGAVLKTSGIETDTGVIAGDTTSIDTKLTDASQKSQIVDGAGAVIGSTANALDVNIASSVGLTVDATDLDIRDLTSVSDSVEVLQGTAGSLNMTEASAGDIKTSVELIDDSVYSDGTGTPDKGILIMGTDGTNPQALSVNTDGELKVNLESVSTIGIKTNAAVGLTAEQLTTDDTTCKKAVVTANFANTGRITVGSSSVTDGNGIILYAADSIEIPIDNVNKIYVVSSVDGEDVTATYFV